MGMKASNAIATFFKYLVLILVGLIMIYPLLWMVSAKMCIRDRVHRHGRRGHDKAAPGADCQRDADGVAPAQHEMCIRDR